MASIKRLLNQIKNSIKPTKEEEKQVNEKINNVIKKINKKLNNAKAILGGSGAKGTWLKNPRDADIFVLFDCGKYKNKSDGLSNILEKILKKRFRKVIRLHGSRDYFQIKEQNFTYEVIPILDIKKAEQAKNITDVSPLHSKWVKKHSKLADEIRLTKQFCKANNVYGAESYIGGFSGYICEVLTIYYGSFLNLIKRASDWKEKTIIDEEGYYRNKNVFDEMNQSKLQSPLIIIDPVQKDRNAAAALTKEKFEKFKKVCKEFLKNPSIEFFTKKGLSLAELKKKAKSNYLIIIEAIPKIGKVDIIGFKLLKIYSYINQNLQKHDFNVIDSCWEWDQKKVAVFYYIIEKKELSLKKIKLGPPIKEKEHVKRFSNKYKKTFVKDNRLYAEIKRKFLTPDELIEELIKDAYAKEKVKKIDIIEF